MFVQTLNGDWTLKILGTDAGLLPREGLRTICQEIGAAYPGYQLQIAPDVDISD